MVKKFGKLYILHLPEHLGDLYSNEIPVIKQKYLNLLINTS